MCGRYYFSIDLGNLSFVENIDGFTFEENFNIAPQTSVPVVIDNKLRECTWGYYPQWLKDQSNSRPLFNTRFESLLEKKTFISAFKKSRCLVPISGWYEWKVVDEGKQPYFFKNTNDENLLAAGLYWDRSDGSTEFTIITTAAPVEINEVHDRSPLILDDVSTGVWLSDDEPEDIHSDISHDFGNRIEFYQVSKSVNNPKNNNEELIKEFTELPF